jgi:ketosteroid isomerase-like protein
MLLVAALFGCAGKAKPRAEPQSSGFASADAKNVHDFLVKYPGVVMSGDVKAIRRLYTDDARIVPFLGNAVRPVKAGEMGRRLPEMVAAERAANLRIAFHEPMNIEAKGDRASAQVVADLSWQEQGKTRQAVMNCYFGLARDENYLWKIREAHGEPVRPGFALPAQKAPLKPLPPRDGTLKGSKKTVRKVTGEPQSPAQPAAPPAPAAPPVPPDTGAPPEPAAPADGQTPQPLF